MAAKVLGSSLSGTPEQNISHAFHKERKDEKKIKAIFKKIKDGPIFDCKHCQLDLLISSKLIAACFHYH